MNPILSRRYHCDDRQGVKLMNDAPFFIVGLGRSGTTLIRLMLHNHPNIAIPYESHFITKYFERASEYGDLTIDMNLRNLLQDILSEELLSMWDHEFNLERILNRVKERTIGGAISAVYMDYTQGKSKSRWGDKSDYLNRMHIINKIYPNAQFIHIVRDGRDVANSVIKMPWGPKDIIAAGEWWDSNVRLGRRMGSIIGERRYMEVKYEDLVENPEKELIRICGFIGEEFSTEMLKYHEKSKESIPIERKEQHYNSDRPPTSSRTYAWKREMSSSDVALFSNYGAGSLSEMGYELPAIKTPKLRMKLAKMRVFIGRMVST